jgi:hypothetical protein
VTEAEWLACKSPQKMLEFLRGKASERKLRILMCASLRRVWDYLDDERFGRAVEVAERYCDGPSQLTELDEARTIISQINRRRRRQHGWDTQSHLVLEVLYPPREVSAVPFTLDPHFPENLRWSVPEAKRGEELRAQVALLRCVLGNPFRAASLGGACRTRLIRSLAQAAYEQRTLPAGTLEPARLAVLADALDEAGLTDAEVLTHLHSGGPHVRGCWAVDVVLGLE